MVFRCKMLSELFCPVRMSKTGWHKFLKIHWKPGRGLGNIAQHCIKLGIFNKEPLNLFFKTKNVIMFYQIHTLFRRKIELLSLIFQVLSFSYFKWLCAWNSICDAHFHENFVAKQGSKCNLIPKPWKFTEKSGNLEVRENLSIPCKKIVKFLKPVKSGDTTFWPCGWPDYIIS